MHKTSRLARSAVAAAALFVTASAFADGTYVAELGVSHLGGKEVHKGGNSGDSAAWSAAFGYELPNGLGARVMALGDLNPVRGFLSTDRSFDNFIGVQATGSFEVAPKLNLKGGLGIGRSNLDEGPNDDHKITSDGVLSVGLQYRFATHYAMELRVDLLTSSNVTSAGVQFQVPF